MALTRSSLLLCLALAPYAAPAATAPADPAGGGSPPPAGVPLPINPREQISVDCKSGVANYKKQTLVCRNVVISQGSTRVTADRASSTGGLDFKNSRWIFTGNVQIEAPPRGSLRSDDATVEFRDNRIAAATVNGNPAEFEQQRLGDLGMEKGHADQIVYDVSGGTILLSKDAWISDGRNEMSAPSISYSISEQKVLATSGGATQGVHITITPQSLPKQGSPPHGKGASKPAPASGAPTPPAPTHASGAGSHTAPPPQGRS